MALVVRRIEASATAARVDQDAPPMNRVSLLVRNRGTRPVFLGDSSVTANTGFQLDPGESESVDLVPPEQLYVITASDTSLCHIIQVSV